MSGQVKILFNQDCELSAGDKKKIKKWINKNCAHTCQNGVGFLFDYAEVA
jgi:hypothetical protein